MYKLEYLELAKKDMEDNIYYISHNLNNKTAAYNLANDFIKEANKLLKFPYANTEYIPIKPLKNRYRSHRIKNFLIFYIVNEENKRIVIARILYKRRDLDKILV